MEASINGIGVTGGFGCGLNDLVECLKGTSSPVITADENNPRISYPAFKADTSYLEDKVPKRALRRIDHFSQLALTGAYLAMDDAGLDHFDREKTGIVICSGYGSAKTTFSFLDSIIDDGDSCASPTLFSNSVHNAAAGHISMLLGLEGPCLTVSQFEMSVPSALLSATQWLQEGRVEQVLFGAVDEYCDVLGYCYQRFFGTGKETTITPLVPGVQSAIPGEGAAFLLLSKVKSMTRNYGNISSVKITDITDKDAFPGEDSFFILNADGHSECDSRYADIIPEKSEISCYTPIYGSMPIGTAFDMAIAALSIREEKLFPSPESVGHLDNLKVLRENRSHNKKNICCVKIGRQGELSIITLVNG
ncbi:beta-ketoacyl synthase N-terminal-like domain-containing protein [Thermodesulfobacteriota bacterium]